MKNLIFLVFAIVFLAGCAGTFSPRDEEESLTMVTNPDGSVTIKYISKTFNDSRKFGPLNLAKSGNVTPDNAVEVTDTYNTKVSTNNRTYRAESNRSVGSNSPTSLQPGNFAIRTQNIIDGKKNKADDK